MGLCMPRRKTISQNHFPYHVYNRSVNQDFFKVPMPELWRIFSEEAYFMSTLWGGQIHALELMGNHYHMILSTPDANISQCMCDFQSEVARRISSYLGKPSYRFQSRYRWSIITNSTHFRAVYKYVYQNPIRAGICESVTNYPYSTFHGLIGNSRLVVPIKPSVLAPELFEVPSNEHIEWLNETYQSEETEWIRKGLKKPSFEIHPINSTKTRREQFAQKI